MKELSESQNSVGERYPDVQHRKIDHTKVAKYRKLFTERALLKLEQLSAKDGLPEDEVTSPLYNAKMELAPIPLISFDFEGID